MLKEWGFFVTDIYVKAKHGQKYLHYKSSHAEHIKKINTVQPALRLNRICSSEEDVKGHIDRMTENRYIYTESGQLYRLMVIL